MGTPEGMEKGRKAFEKEMGSDIWKEVGKLGGAKRTPNTKNKGLAQHPDIAKHNGKVYGVAALEKYREKIRREKENEQTKLR